ncbi:MAG: hypothetical protein KDA45_15265, partial [Planctomycetales bacterium]|nr:hypothetical protein [Planctomycetales bacterium]
GPELSSERSCYEARRRWQLAIQQINTPGYVPLAGGSHHSPGATSCRYSVAGRFHGLRLR